MLVGDEISARRYSGGIGPLSTSLSLSSNGTPGNEGGKKSLRWWGNGGPNATTRKKKRHGKRQAFVMDLLSLRVKKGRGMQRVGVKRR